MMQSSEPTSPTEDSLQHKSDLTDSTLTTEQPPQSIGEHGVEALADDETASTQSLTGTHVEDTAPYPSSAPDQQIEPIGKVHGQHHHHISFTKKLVRLLQGKKPSKDEDPQDFPPKKKAFIIFMVAFAGFISPITSNVYLPAILDIQTALNTNAVVINATIAVYILMMGIAPLGWASFSDHFHTRRQIYVISLAIHTVASCICAISNSIGLFFVMRIIQSIGGSAVQSVGAGTVSDLYIPSQRGRAFSFYSLGPMIGPLLGPIVGGYLDQYLTWRSIFWFLAILGGVINIAILFFLPETFRRYVPAPLAIQPTTGNTEAIQQPDAEKAVDPKALEAQGGVRKCRHFVNPIAPLKLLKLPFVWLIAFQVGIVFGSYFLINTTLPRSESAYYGLSSSTTGLTYIAGGIGNILGSLIGGRLSDWNLRRLKAKHPEGRAVPEMRLATVWISGLIIMPAGALIFGWLEKKRVYFIWPLLGNLMFGMGCMMNFNAVSTFFVDAFPRKSASSIAVNNFVRNILATAASIAAEPIWVALGNGWMGVIIAALSVISVGANAIVIKNGERWRKQAHLDSTVMN